MMTESTSIVYELLCILFLKLTLKQPHTYIKYILQDKIATYTSSHKLHTNVTYPNAPEVSKSLCHSKTGISQHKPTNSKEHFFLKS